MKAGVAALMAVASMALAVPNAHAHGLSAQITIQAPLPPPVAVMGFSYGDPFAMGHVHYGPVACSHGPLYYYPTYGVYAHYYPIYRYSYYPAPRYYRHGGPYYGGGYHGHDGYRGHGGHANGYRRSYRGGAWTNGVAQQRAAIRNNFNARRFPAPSILALVSVLADGLFVPEGGMGSLPQVLAESVRARGGTITPGAPVDRIIRKPGGGFSVHTGSGRPFDCRWVLSTASPYKTLGRMLHEARLPLSWQRRLARPRLSMKVLSVQLGLRGVVETLSHLNHHLPSPESMESYFAPDPGAVDWVYASLPSLVAPGLAPAEGSVVELYPADGPGIGRQQEKCLTA